MIALSLRKIKYNGSIRKACTPFVANDSDRELLASWGCVILDSDRKDDVHQDDVHQDGGHLDDTHKDEPKQEEAGEQPNQVTEPSAKKPRKRTKS